MTVEEQRYLDECRKMLNKEQFDMITMAMDYGLPISDIRQVVQSNKSAPCMKELIFALMENIESTAIKFLCEGEFNSYQIKEIVEGIRDGLTFDQVKTYASAKMSANRMKKMRSQLVDSLQENNHTAEEDEVRDYMKGLMEIMDHSIQQFQESNARFDALAALVKEHVVEEKNREIKDLYENLKYKDKKIQELQTKLAEREKQRKEFQTEIPKSQIPEIPLAAHKAQKEKSEETESKEIAKLIPKEKGRQSQKRRMLGWFLGGQVVETDVLDKILAAELSTEQLEEVKKCMDSGLTDQEIVRVIANHPEADRIGKMREILLLMKQRKGGA
ncbi:MAG: hypothetical protein ACK5MN_02775 [Lachnospiraceae bacterium]